MSAMTRQSMMRGVEAGTVAGPALGKKGAALSRKSLGEALGRKSQRFGGRRNTPYESARARMNWQNAVRLVRLSRANLLLNDVPPTSSNHCRPSQTQYFASECLPTSAAWMSARL